MKLTKRDHLIIDVLMQLYLGRRGNPVSSKSVACDPRINLSSATVRNAMARLEQLGVLYSPHTSAGRIPTEQAFIHWFKHLRINAQLLPRWCPSNEELVGFAQSMSERYQSCVFVKLPPVTQLQTFRVEIVDFDQRRWLVLLIDNLGHSENVLINKPLEANEAIRISLAGWMNTVFVNSSLSEGLRRMKAIANTAPMFCHGSLSEWTHQLNLKLGQINHLTFGEGSLFDSLGYIQASSLNTNELISNISQQIEGQQQIQMILNPVVSQGTLIQHVVFSFPYFDQYGLKGHICVIQTKAQASEGLFEDFYNQLPH